MRTIGIDLAVTAKHRAIIADERGQYTSLIISFDTDLAALDQLRARAQGGRA